MAKKLGILLFLLVLFGLNSPVIANSVQLKDNLNFKISPITYAVEKHTEVVEQKNETVNPTAQLILNDKVLNLMMYSKMPVRPEGMIYTENSYSFDVIDPVSGVNANNSYPGLRGPNQFVVYTPNYGLRTGTNEFGTEAIVVDNMVVQLNGADSIIPKNGFVISGHGKAKNWILKNIQVGSKVYIDYIEGNIKVYLTPESLLFSAKEKIKEINNVVEYYRTLDILYNDKKANDYLTESKEFLRKAEDKPEKTQVYINEAMQTLDISIKNAIPYIASELKGVWIRPVEKTKHEIQKTIDKISQAGITDIFLETYFHGKTIYPSEYLKECGVISQREEFVGFDPLEIWIKEAHKKNLKIHVWFETFYVGNDNPKTTPNHVLNVYPVWSNKRLMNYDSTEPVSSLSEHNGYFLDPANLQVQTYLLGILRELVTKYKPDGINLDYIRYPQTVDSSFSNYAQMNWGYTEYARAEFRSLYGIDPIEIKYGTPEWDAWALYRQKQITEFVIEAKKIAKENDSILTAVVFPDIQKSTSTKMQNWKVWSLNNYVDGLTPLILTCDKNTAELLIKDIVDNTSPITKIYPGLFVTFMGGSIEDLLLQIHKTREYKTSGNVLFDYAHLNSKYVDALMTRVFNENYELRDSKLKIPEKTQINDSKKKKKRKNIK